MLVIAVLVVALIVTFLVNREQRDMHRFKNVFIRMMQKFDSWQMLR
ncbi:hypothetical protein ACFOTA_17145 [Chitinophaga sp. GCM10012297]|uniref:Uncharacterized protein n=1 Tax=Chitinophaga chungangae TaxID=2821488 RepID=A0ABS3YGX9_9BACT|nr:hypothetical protein [Chitinophaga chungangae]MBO9153948.1 hypothetical protein [Chitinophaga chungangae]